MSKIAFVTGATGFVGSHLAEELVRRGSYDEVRCLVRSRFKWLDGVSGVTPVRATLGDLERIWEALRGVTHVYHLGGVTRARDWRTYQENNVRATLTLLGAVAQTASDDTLERVLVTSSLAAVGRYPGEAATEDAELRPVSRYGRSKAQMERALAEQHDMRASFHDQLPITVARPPAVYGPRDRDILDFFKAVNWGVCPVVGGGGERISLVFVEDLARGLVEAAEADAAAGETYFLGGPGSERGAAPTWNDVKAAAAEALDRRALTVPVPGPLVGAVGAASEAWGRLTGRYPPLNREKAREIRHACTVCSSKKAHADFGYAPSTPLAEGVAETIRWYREEGWL
jgi:nucleoside-diphosphate-sugar epimerase